MHQGIFNSVWLNITQWNLKHLGLLFHKLVTQQCFGETISLISFIRRFTQVYWFRVSVVAGQSCISFIYGSYKCHLPLRDVQRAYQIPHTSTTDREINTARRGRHFFIELWLASVLFFLESRERGIISSVNYVNWDVSHPTTFLKSVQNLQVLRKWLYSIGLQTRE